MKFVHAMKFTKVCELLSKRKVCFAYMEQVI